MPTGVASTGTSQASASSTASPNPSRSEGTSTAFAAFINSGTAVGVDPTEREQLGAARHRDGAVVTLLRSRWIRGEEQVGAVGAQPELLARRLARERAEALEVDAAGQHLRSQPRRFPRDLLHQSGGGGAEDVDEGEGEPGQEASARMAQIRPVQRERAHACPHGQRGPRAEAEMRVHHVEALPSVVAPELGRGAHKRPRARRELEQLQLDALDALERAELIAHEAAPLGVARERSHVRHNESAQHRRNVAVAVAPGALGS